MKKCVILMLFVCIAVAFSGCGASESTGAAPAETTALPYVVNQMEYVEYINVFQNNQAADYLGKAATKTGVFASIYDSFNGKTRYYVWGYMDNTRCCDWQWELKADTLKNPLPANGSQVMMTGKLMKSDQALDGYWFDVSKLEVKINYKGPDCDIDLTCLSDTLERVQNINMQVYPEEYEGKTVYMYGRVKSETEIEDPYYDGSWSQPVKTDSVPAFGTMVIANGVYRNGVIDPCTLTATDAY